MKNIKILFLTLTLLLVSFVSCKDKLEENVYSDLLTSNAFQTEEDAAAVVIGVYRSLRSVGYNYYQTNYIKATDVASDQGDQNGNDMNLGTWTNESGTITGLWNDAYGLIGAANLALKALSQIDMDETLKGRYEGEVKFLRALGYYDLTFHFKDVILNLGQNEDNKDLGLSPQSEIIAAIISDLTDAIALLPEMSAYSEEDIGRASKGAALSLRAKTHLNAGNWQAAADDAFAVINSGEHSLSLPYDQLFRRGNINDSEFIFSMKSSQLGDKNTVPKTYISVQTLWGTVQSGGWGSITSTVGLYKSYDLNDDRRKLFANGYNWKQREFDPENPRGYYAIPGTPEVTDPGPAPGQELVDLLIAPVIKYERPRGLAESGPSHDGGLNFPIIRYAEVILTRAEALNELNGGSAEAVSLVNQVRARAGLAGLPSGLSQTQLRDVILEERGKEFFLEGKRRIDLIRHGKLIELWKASLYARYPNTPETTYNFEYITKETHTYYPIPQSELDVNDNIN